MFKLQKKSGYFWLWLIVISQMFVYAQAGEITPASIASDTWHRLDSKARDNIDGQMVNSVASKSARFNVDITTLNQVLLNNQQIQIALPTPEHKFVEFILTPSQAIHADLLKKYPSIRTFTGVEKNNPLNKGQFDITPSGFHGVFTLNDEIVYIDPILRNNNRLYHSYYQKNALPLDLSRLPKRLPPIKHQHKLAAKSSQHRDDTLNPQSLTTYRLAIATTGEYAQYHGGTVESTLAALATLVTRLNAVYQRDLSIAFQLVASNDSIVFTDKDNDPFDNTDQDIDVAQQVIDDAIGTTNYDIGHVVGTGGGGLAVLGAVCGLQKAEGITGSPDPTGDAFYIDFVAHEIGHQFGAEHTFNGSQGNCQDNRSSVSAYEPGSGSTIMAYAGICGEQNLQDNSDPYFHVHSIDQIRTYTSQNVCGSPATKTNTAPVVEAGNNYTIPAKTPFMLTGSATDAENDQLSYSWEQYDLGAETASANEDATDDGSRPLFRAFSPQASATRILPKLADILANRSSYGEALPTTARDLNFRFVVRDNHNNVAYDNMKVTVVEVSDGFTVNNITAWNGSAQTVTWQTAGTENAPVSCSNVDILLSTNAGESFDIVLADDVPNTGSADVNVDNMTTSRARVKIMCSDNIFFDINDQNFIVNVQDATPTKPEYQGQEDISTDEDNSITITKAMLMFKNNKQVDSLTVFIGENYSFNGTMIMPNENFNGRLNVNMTATKDDLESDLFQVQVMVTAVNDAPIAIADTITLEADSAQVVIDVLANDSDVEDQQLTVTAFSYSGTGAVVIVDNKIAYTPASGFTGTETINYTVRDSENATASADLTITVNAKPVTPPTTPPSNEGSSSGGSLYYLLLLMLLAWQQKYIRGQRYVA